MPDRRASSRRDLLFGAGLTAVLAGVAFAAYQEVTREPRSEWITGFIQRHPSTSTSHVSMWVPGVSTRADYERVAQLRLALGSKSPAECPVAFFPYSSKVVALDLVAALTDKLNAVNLRPQIINIQLAIAQFLLNYQTVSIVCHSHGGLLVHRALEGLGIRDTAGRISVSAFGPAHLVMRRTPKYSLRFALNWVNLDDVLRKFRILKLPDRVPGDGEVHSYEFDGGTVDIVARDNTAHPEDWDSWCPGEGLRPGGAGLGAHSCYPFHVGLHCKVPEVIDLTHLAGNALLNKFSPARNGGALPG